MHLLLAREQRVATASRDAFSSYSGGCAQIRSGSDMGRADEVYRVLHRMRVLVRQVCEATAQVVEAWFGSDAATVAEETAVGKPRLVFASPSREEAEEATNELRDAIERVYFSEALVEVIKEQDKELNKQGADAIIVAMPEHVVQAFTLLKSSLEA